ncbi:hypothetical protein [Actinomadura sp. 9N407]|uniref:hypothetical protein n=1 Tax=Actinomadura sp. 9N407 TaxID=3375154 RepID=UPI0037C0D557
MLAVAVVCAFVCLGGGLFLMLRGSPWLGLGLMSGWLVVGVATAGWCTGLASDFYDPGKQYRQYADRFSSMGRYEAERRAEAKLEEVAEEGRASVRVRAGGCWAYAGREKGLVQPFGSGAVEVVTTLDGTRDGERGQETVDRLAEGLAKDHEAVGRRHEAFFEDAEGFVVELIPGEGDAGVLVTVRSPCLRNLR